MSALKAIINIYKCKIYIYNLIELLSDIQRIFSLLELETLEAV